MELLTVYTNVLLIKSPYPMLTHDIRLRESHLTVKNAIEHVFLVEFFTMVNTTKCPVRNLSMYVTP